MSRAAAVGRSFHAVAIDFQIKDPLRLLSAFRVGGCDRESQMISGIDGVMNWPGVFLTRAGYTSDFIAILLELQVCAAMAAFCISHLASPDSAKPAGGEHQPCKHGKNSMSHCCSSLNCLR